LLVALIVGRSVRTRLFDGRLRAFPLAFDRRDRSRGLVFLPG